MMQQNITDVSIQLDITKIQTQKLQQIEANIEKLQQDCHTWIQSKNILISSLGQQQFQESSNNNEQTDRVELNKQQLIQFDVNNYFFELRKLFTNEEILKLLTTKEINAFLTSIDFQVQSKIKLFKGVQQLRLLEHYPTSQKKTYSFQVTLILKKWLLKHFNAPYPNSTQTKKLISKTKLNKKQIANWFINARNGFKRNKKKEMKFKQLVHHQLELQNICH